jgi:peptide-methionine (S)-S-oxide reductase
MKHLFIIVTLIAAAAYMTWGGAATSNDGLEKRTLMTEKPANYPIATFAGGCFWCTESEFRNHKGVLFTQVGYIGGHLENPKYEDTHDSKSGHAEATELAFDPAQVSYKELVEFFLTQAHDPTQLNRQGPDTGTQYRSAIFYHDEAQKKIAEDVIAELTASKRFKAPIVTTLEPAGTFWTAEAYHQQYYEKYEAKTGQPHINDWLKRQKRKNKQK